MKFIVFTGILFGDSGYEGYFINRDFCVSYGPRVHVIRDFISLLSYFFFNHFLGNLFSN